MLGPDAKRVDQRLNELLEHAAQGKSVETPIVELLAEHEATREWIARYLGPDKLRSFSPTPGLPGHVAADRYACPIPSCRTDWIRRHVGEKVPQCDVHHVILVYAGTT
jgi:hypothetical protein